MIETTDGQSGRWMAVGRSALADAFEAGAQATRTAISGPDPKLLVVFCSDSYDLDALLLGIHSVSNGTPLIGCSTAGEIATGTPGDNSVVVSVLGGEGFSVATAAQTGFSDDLRGTSARVADCVEALDERPHRVLMLLSDGLAGDQQEVVRGAYEVVGASVPLVGGCAGDGLKMRRTYQLFDDTVLEDAVVGAAIGSTSPMGIGVQHGWRRVGEAMVVSHSAGNRVHRLDDRPALDVYLERLDAPVQARDNPESFTRFAMTHPLGISKRSGEEVRFVGEANFEDRSLGCIAEVPRGGLAWLMEGDDSSVLAATDSACTEALGMIGQREPLGIFAFDCIARRGVLGDEGIQREVSRIGRLAHGAPVAGFYTYGEFARIRGMSGFHNQTLVVLAVS